MRALFIACLCSLGALAGSAAAQPQPQPHEISPVTVYPAGVRPKVVATFPAAGQAIAGGVTILTVTFDQQMSPGGFDLTPAAGGEAPPCLKIPRLLNDGKTFAWLCTSSPGKTYALAFNAGPQGGFVNIADQRAAPSTLTFTTTASVDGPRDIAAAIKQAHLTAFDVPIQETPGLAGKP